MNVISVEVPGMPARELAERAAEDSAAGPELTTSIVRAEPASIMVIGLFILAVLYTFYFARALLLPIVLAVLFSLLLSPVVRLLTGWGLPEPAGAAIVMICLLAGIGGGVYTLKDPARE